MYIRVAYGLGFQANNCHYITLGSRFPTEHLAILVKLRLRISRVLITPY